MDLFATHSEGYNTIAEDLRLLRCWWLVVDGQASKLSFQRLNRGECDLFQNRNFELVQVSLVLEALLFMTLKQRHQGYLGSN